MTKRALADIIKDKTGITATLAHDVVEDIIRSMSTSLKRTGRYSLSGFGTFTVHKIKQRKFVNPRTGEPISTKPKARRTVRFKASPLLRGKV
jgi:DNA-binding protein HU-beta